MAAMSAMADMASPSGNRAAHPAVRDMIDAAVLIDVDGGILEVSPAFEALSGWTEGELAGLPLQHLHAPEPDDKGGARRHERPFSARDDQSEAQRRRYRHRDGGVFWGEIVTVPLRAADRAPDGFVLILRDASAGTGHAADLMAMVAFLAKQKSHGDVDLDGLLDLGCRFFDLDAGIFFRPKGDGWCIEAVSGHIDRSLADLVDAFQPPSTLSSDDEAAAIERAPEVSDRSTALSREAGFGTCLSCAVQGVDRHVGTLCFVGREPRGRPFNESEREVLRFVARWLATWLVADEAKRSCENANRRLRKSEERYRILYEKTPAMLHSIDDRGCLASVSDTWLATLGYSREEVIGRPSIDFLTSESKRYAEDVALPAYRSVGHCNDIAYQMVTRNGDTRDVLLSAISLADDDGAFLQSLAVLLDVTERRRIERCLAKKTTALQRSNADLTRFAHIASHDLQEPLRRIIAYCDILKEDYGAELSENAAEITGVIQSGGRRLRLMINDLLTYVRVSEQFDCDAEPVDLDAILCHVLDDLDEGIQSRHARVDVAHLPLVWGRAPLLTTLLRHLLSNAIIHGGGRSLAIQVSAQDLGEFWQFAVTDNGVGIESRFADRIFEFFQQLHLKDENSGSGAGLAICRLIVQRCDGDIWLDPSYDCGARFVFTLPKGKPKSLDPAEVVSLTPPG